MDAKPSSSPQTPPIGGDLSNDRNTTADGTQVSFTSSSLPLTCKSGYYGNLTYTCNESGVFASAGLCIKNCTIPSTANTTVDNSSVAPTSTSVALTCKTGFSGGVDYTCSNDGILSTTGTCNAITCTYKETGSGNSQCLSTINETRTFNVGDNGVMLCPYGAGGNANSNPPQRDMKYRCNSDGTMQYDVRLCCYENSSLRRVQFNSKHPYDQASGVSGNCRYTYGRSEFYCVWASYSCAQAPNYWSF